MTLADLSPLANHLWQSTLCVAAAWLLTLALRKNRAAVRYWLWLAASVKFLIPFSLLVSIGSHVGWRTAPVIVQPQWTSVIDDVGVPFTASAPVIQTAVPQASNLIPAILFCVWLCGFAVTVAFWLRCLRRVQVARRGAAPLALDLPIRVLSSRSLIEPGIFGIFRPVLLLPEGITECLNAAQLDAIFAHEMCHVRRGDNLTAAIHMMVETIFWFHPLVWWIRTRLVEERERACDEEVLNSGGDPGVYAEGILNVCKFYLQSPLACVSGVTGSDLKKRMERIMRNRVGETLAGWRRLFLTMVGVVALAGPLVFGLVNSPRIRAQSLLPPSVAPLPSFEVASIKVNKNASVGVGRINLAQPGGHLAASNVSLKFLIIQAYQPTHLHLGPNPKGAEWIDSDHFDDQQGVYTFMDLDDGQWKFQVEMLGFATQTQDIAITAAAPSPMWELKLLPLEEITRGLEPVNTASAETPSPPAAANGKTPTAAAPPASRSGGFQRATVNSAAAAPPPAPANDASSASNEASENATPGLLVNGSVNNGAASAFSQMAAFGNNRKGPGSLYNGGLGIIFDTSSWDAAPFSVTGLTTPKPSYNDVQIVSALGGPLGIPHHLISNANFFVAYQHQANDNATTLPGRVPTLLERGGNLSQTLNPATGQPVQIYNPATNMLFPGSVVPVSPQAQALLNEYPLPNVSTPGAYNYEAPVLSSSQQDSVQTRITKNSGRNQFFGNLAYQRQAAQTTSIFGFTDATNTSGLDSAVNWSHYYRPGGTSFLSVHFKYEFSRFASNVTPYFANRANISGEAGISGNDQTPTSWGPPNLLFSTGVAGLSEPQYARNVNQTQAFTYDSLWNRGHHNFQWGGDVRRQQFNVRSQQNARGTFTFTGADTQAMSGGLPVTGTGSDLADFLIGVPDAVGISFGNADKYLRGWSYDAFINDDWRLKSGLTLNVGLRWEFATPLTEVHDRLANLDIAPGFTAATPVVASDPTGAVTGQTYPNSLLRPDFRGFEPRLGLAWRPRANSPLVIRAGYGIYDNTAVYPTIGTLLAEQPPFTKTLSIQNSVADPLTLATAFNAAPPATPNTFAANPDFRIGYAQNWDLSVQQDLPGSLVMTATYLGTKGTRLMQESLPNTFPLGATNPCPTCPAGFVYLDSNGDSTREAGQIQLRRRLRDGLTATLQYTYSKAIDDASAFSGAGLTTVSAAAATSATATSSSNPTTPTASPSIAQNWLNLRAERGPSTFDQRNLLNFQMQYTTGAGIHGGALLAGRKGTLLKEWTVTAQLTAGSGLPLTPVYLTNVTGTAVTGTVRPDYTGAPVREAPPGLFLNPAAYTAPAPGQWGDAGRNSIVGPAQFSLNTSIGRTFRLGSRLFADWRMDATNVLNNVTYTSWNTTFTSPLFGLPNQANTMRKLQTTFRVRF